MGRSIGAAAAPAPDRWRRVRHRISLAVALLLPLAVPAGWLSLELRAAHGRAAEALAAGADHAGGALGDVLGRFDRIALGLRLPESPADAAALTARLLRLEPLLAPASALLVVDARGHLVASSHPLGGAALDASGTAWFRAAMAAAEARPVLAAPPGPTPLGGPDGYAIARRIDGPQGAAAGVAVTFLPADALSQAIRPGWLAGRGAGIRLSDAADGRPLVEIAAAPADPSAGPRSRLVAGLRSLTSALPGHPPVAAAAIDIVPGGLRWEATLDPWTLLAADAGGLARRAAWAAGAALALALAAAFAVALARSGGGGGRAAAPLRAAAVAAAAAAPAAASSSTDGDDAGAAPHRRTEAADAAAERDRVLAAIGHDVRTPLNSILGIAALLLDGDLEDAQRRWVQRIRASCELLLAMLNGLLEACSAHGDGAELNADEVELADLVREVCEVLRPQAHDKGLELNVAVDDAALGTWRTDPTRVRQVLFNLAGNAIKYTDHGSVEVRASVASTHEGREVVRVQVADTGPGIEPEERARIFERFRRGRGEVAAGREGVGLGLALCRDIATLMGGALTLESTPGAGSVFTFDFPAERLPAGGRRRGVPFPGRTALVVGLSEGVRRRVALHLRGLGFAVETAGDGFVGLGLAERTAATQGALDLVVLDGGLAGLPAEAFLLRLRANRQLEAARVVWVTAADATAPDPVDAVVPHPAEPRDLDQAVFRLLGPTSALQAVDPDAPAPAQGRVLVVEDNKINQALLADALRRAGFSVFTANDGEEAVRAAGRGGFDLVLMDVQMPGIDGIEATRRIRDAEAVGGRRPTPVVALTAHTGSAVRRRCLEAGATAVFHKPIDPVRLSVQLRAVMAVQRTEAPPPGADVPPPPADGACTAQAESCAAADIEVEYLEALVLEVGAVRAREALRDFLADVSARVPRLEELLIAAEWAPVRRGCHDLAGLAGTFGAASLADALAALGHAAHDRDPRRAERAIAEVAAALDRVRSVLPRTLEAILARRGGVGQGRAA